MWQPRFQTVLDDDQRGPALGTQLHDRIPYGRGVLVIEHRGRLVQQEHQRLEHQRAGEREALQLTAGERPRGVTDRVRERDGLERRPHPDGHLRLRHSQVLQAERDVAADPVGDNGSGRILKQQADGAGPRLRRLPAHRHRAGQVPHVGGQQQPGQGTQQRGLARAARTGKEHPLAGLDAQVEAGEDGRTPTGGAPGQVADLHRGAAQDRTRHRRGAQLADRSASSWPGGSARIAPVRASARTRSRPPSPATTTPETAKLTRYQTRNSQS